MLNQLRGDYFNSLIWVRVNSEKVGITRTPDHIHIPGYLFSGRKEIVSSADHHGRLGMDLSMGEAAQREIFLDSGTWHVEALRSGEAVQIAVLNPTTKDSLFTGNDFVNVELDYQQTLIFEVSTANSRESHFRGLSLNRFR
jgi:hypothetical protein